MPITGVHKFTVYDNVDRTIYTTASLTASPYRLYLLLVGGRRGSGSPTVSSLTGGGLTWTQIASAGAGSSPSFLFRAMSSSPGAAAALTITFSLDMIGASWSLWEFDGVEISGSNGADAVVQVIGALGSGTATDSTTTLAAFADASNRTYIGTRILALETITLKAGYTSGGSVGGGSPNYQTNTGWNATTPDTTPSASWTSSVSWHAFVAELRVLPGAVSGSAALAFSQSGAAAGDGAVGGSAAFAMGQAGGIGGTGAIGGTSPAVFGQSGSAMGAAAAAGISPLAIGQAGAASAAGALAGTSPLVLSQAANAGGVTSAAGVAGLAIGQAGAIGADATLAGSAALAIGQAGQMSGAAAVAGSSGLVLGQAGAIGGAGALAGHAALTFGAVLDTIFVVGLLHLAAAARAPRVAASGAGPGLSASARAPGVTASARS